MLVKRKKSFISYAWCAACTKHCVNDTSLFLAKEDPNNKKVLFIYTADGKELDAWQRSRFEVIQE